MPRHYVRGRFDRVCAACGVDFSVGAYVLRAGGGRYCSRACMTIGRRHRVTIICKSCGVAVQQWPAYLASGRGQFCSVPCWRAYDRTVGVIERFWSHVERGGGPDDCWRWRGTITAHGYGKDQSTAAHRKALEMVAGPLPKGMLGLHTCDVRACVRNDEPGIYVVRGIARPRWGHLWIGTHLDNMADMVIKGRQRNQWLGTHHTSPAIWDR